MKISGTAIVIVGETLIDAFPDEQVIGGAPFNVARTLAYFDCAPLMISRIGNDAASALISADMQRFKLGMQGMQTDSQHATGKVAVKLDDSGDKSSHTFEILPEQAYDYIDAGLALQARADTCPQHDQGILYFGTLAQRHTCSRQAVHALLTQTRALKYLDLNLRAMQYSLATIELSLQFADVLKVNEEELQVLAEIYLNHENRNTALDATTIQHTAAALIRLFHLQAVITTLGARGYAYVDAAGQYLDSSTQPIQTEVVDTVGGGDAFSAIFLLGLQRQWPLNISLQRAHEFAAAICGVRGAVARDLHFYRLWQDRWDTARITPLTGAGT
ncbi:PfkB family carbohydrate kinase [Undibacterium sp. TJN19]|uniref:PfkB family carbohydrate kinase n=1 Tax=Undibacterium sp. TJN19 TaxID=3413055 RepID=UPI003BF24675